MKKGYTHIGLVLDASGSMFSIREDVLGSLRSFAEDQLAAQEADETNRLDVWQFSNEVRHILNNALLKDYSRIDYRCDGCTALYDAVCVGIDDLGRQFAAMPEEERPEDVVFVIVTDGYENASKEFCLGDVRKRIETQSKVYSWRFVFLASNIDVDAVGESMGLASGEDCVELSNEDFAGGMGRAMSRVQASVRAERRERRARGE